MTLVSMSFDRIRIFHLPISSPLLVAIFTRGFGFWRLLRGRIRCVDRMPAIGDFRRLVILMRLGLTDGDFGMGSFERFLLAAAIVVGLTTWVLVLLMPERFGAALVRG